MSEHERNDIAHSLNIQDSAIVGDINVNQNIASSPKCPGCHSISPTIIACKICEKLYSCDLCNSEKEAIVKTRLEKEPSGYFRTGIHKKVFAKAKKDLQKCCIECTEEYLKLNDLRALSGYLDSLSSLLEFHKLLFDSDNYIWEKLDVPYGQTIKFQLDQFEYDEWHQIRQIPEILPRIGGYPSNLTQYLNILIRNYKLYLYSAYTEDFEREVTRKENLKSSVIPKSVVDDEKFLLIQFDLRGSLKQHGQTTPSITLNSNIYPITYYNGKGEKVFLKRELKTMNEVIDLMTHPNDGWELDFELEMDYVRNDERDNETTFLCFKWKGLLG